MADDAGMTLGFKVVKHTRAYLARTNFDEIARSQVTAQACGSDLVPAILERDLDVEYVYYDKNDSQITSVMLERGDCA